jgi:RNA polymerase sigma-70 factor (ECF subfamily)
MTIGRPGSSPLVVPASVVAPVAAESEPGAVHTPAEAARLRSMVDDHFDFVFRTLRALGVRSADAEDGAQTVFIIASRKLALITLGSERAFLFATARGVASNARRSGVRNREDVSSDVLPATVDQAPDPEEAAARSEARAQLVRIMDGMDEDSRAVFLLFELEGLTMVEIAKVVDAPQGTVASRLRRAREHFERESRELSLRGGLR